MVYTQRTDLSAYIGDWINSVIRRLERKWDFKHMQKKDTGTMVIGDYTIAIPIPATYKDSLYFKVLVNGKYKKVRKESIEYANAYLSDLTSDTGTPEIFAEDYPGAVFLLRPTADLAYDWEHMFLQRSAELSADGDENWWTLYAWELILYGALVESKGLMKDHPDMDMWEKKFNELKNDIIREQTLAVFKGSTPQQKNDFTV